MFSNFEMKKNARPLEEEDKPTSKKYRESCDACSTSKVKCSQEHPTCSRCLNIGARCNYSVSQRKGKPRRRANSNLGELQQQQQQRRQRSASTHSLGVKLREKTSDGPAMTCSGDVFNCLAVSQSLFDSPVQGSGPWSDPISYDHQTGLSSSIPSRASSSISSDSVYPSRTNSAGDTVVGQVARAGRHHLQDTRRHFPAVSTVLPHSTATSSPSGADDFAVVSQVCCPPSLSTSPSTPLSSSGLMPNIGAVAPLPFKTPNVSSTLCIPSAPHRDHLAFSTLQTLYFPPSLSFHDQNVSQIFTFTNPAVNNLCLLLTTYPFAYDPDFALLLAQIIFKLLSWYACISSSPSVKAQPAQASYVTEETTNPMLVQCLIEKLRQVDNMILEFEEGLKGREEGIGTGSSTTMVFAMVANMRERLRGVVASVAGGRRER
ncbi:MAG: hypothetical protein Q9190_000924 [Brigantiaea leucoxantha]